MSAGSPLTSLRAAWNEAIRRKAEDECRRLEARYSIEKNTLDALDAYQTERLIGEEIPEWVLRYFDEAADNLGALEDAVHHGGGGKDFGPAVAEALGFKEPGQSGAWNAFTRRRRGKGRWVRLAILVQEHIEATGDKPMFAVEAKREKPSKATVWRAVRRAKELMEQGAITQSPTS